MWISGLVDIARSCRWLFPCSKFFLLRPEIGAIYTAEERPPMAGCAVM